MRNDKGFTLIEMMIAMVIILLGLLGLVQAALLSIDHNMRNVLRENGMAVAAERMQETRNMDYTAITTDAAATPANCPPEFIARFGTGEARDMNIRDVINFRYCTNRTVTVLPNALTDNSRQIQISVYWRWKGETYTQTLTSMAVRPI